MSQSDLGQPRKVTTPPGSTRSPLTPPPTDQKSFSVAKRAIALLTQIRAGDNTKRELQTQSEFQLTQEEAAYFDRKLNQSESLLRFVEDKVRLDRYGVDNANQTLVVRMPHPIHERYIAEVEHAIRVQLEKIGSGSGKTAEFAQKVCTQRSTEISFVESDPSNKSKYHPDASFRHTDAKYPGVIIEVAYSQRGSRLSRLAENYLLDSDANVRVVVGVNIAYSEELLEAALSVWRPQVIRTSDEQDELIAVAEVEDEAFRDEKGNHVDHHPGLRLRLSDFACQKIVQKELGETDADIFLPMKELYGYLKQAEDDKRGALHMESLGANVRKRKRSATPPDEILPAHEAKYAKKEEKAGELADDDTDYQDNSSTNSLSD